jgi:hypothetical protein
MALAGQNISIACSIGIDTSQKTEASGRKSRSVENTPRIALDALIALLLSQFNRDRSRSCDRV